MTHPEITHSCEWSLRDAERARCMREERGDARGYTGRLLVLDEIDTAEVVHMPAHTGATLVDEAAMARLRTSEIVQGER